LATASGADGAATANFTNDGTLNAHVTGVANATGGSAFVTTAHLNTAVFQSASGTAGAAANANLAIALSRFPK